MKIDDDGLIRGMAQSQKDRKIFSEGNHWIEFSTFQIQSRDMSKHSKKFWLIDLLYTFFNVNNFDSKKYPALYSYTNR